MFDFATIAQTHIHDKEQMNEIVHIKNAARRAVESRASTQNALSQSKKRDTNF